VLALWRFTDQPWYRRRVILPASAMIAGVGLYWTAMRLVTP
jgi:hypothetical protein